VNRARSNYWLVLVAVLLVLGLAASGSGLAAQRPASPVSKITAQIPPPSLSKEELAFVLGRSWTKSERMAPVRIEAGQGRAFVVETFLDESLQEFLVERLEQCTVPLAAVVALDPATGQVKAMASHDRLPGRTDYALTPAFPAASVFKMVTAAAALEAGGLRPGSRIPYHGRAHTLYKGQLKSRRGRFSARPSLIDSFAKSVNPVFGKLALDPLGAETMEEFARRFGFNQPLHFELPAGPSRVEVPRQNRFHLAEIGSGFNRQTTISPLHGALMAAAVVNSGVMMEPSLVDRVRLVGGGPVEKEVYRGRPAVFRRVVSPETAEGMRRLMAATITKGTCRTAFRGFGRDEVLGQLELGAKTGSINDSSQTYRIDWFVGYGQHPSTGRSLALAVLVAHDLERRGTASRVLGREALKHYFKTVFQAAVQAPAGAKPADPDSERKSSSKGSTS